MEEYRPDKLLCVVAHPDDVEVTIGATVAKWSKAGTEVCVLICTDGGKGTAETDDVGKNIAKVRAVEQMAANRTLGVGCWHQLQICDGEVEVCDELRADIVKCIRAHKPDAVFTMDPTFLYSAKYNYANHRDHRAVGQAAFDAVYPMARDATSLPELVEDGFEPHTVRTLLMTHYEKENLFVDVTDSFKNKEDALRAHKSQFGDAAGIVEKLRARASEQGQANGADLVEGMIRLDVSMGS